MKTEKIKEWKVKQNGSKKISNGHKGLARQEWVF